MSVAVDSKAGWMGGAKSPYGASYGKLMMWFFLMSDALSFTGFLSAYGFYRHYYSDLWPSAENVFTHFPFMHGDHPLLYVALMTFILIMSSVTMVLAVEAGHRNSKEEVQKWMLWTILGGIAFLGCQAWEWTHFIVGSDGGLTIKELVNGEWVGRTVFGANLVENEYGPQPFADLFFFITGFDHRKRPNRDRFRFALRQCSWL